MALSKEEKASIEKKLGRRICGAKKRNTDEYCMCRPMKDNERCRYHGGLSLKGLESPRYKNGSASKYAKETVLARIKKYKDDDDVRDLRDELSILRGILHSYMDANNDLLAEERIDTITKLVDKIEKLVSSLKEIEEGHTFTVKNVNNVILQMVRIINSRVVDGDIKKLIAQDVRKIAYVSVT